MKVRLVAAMASSTLLALMCSVAPAMAADSTSSAKPVRVVLIGASISKSWNLPDLPARLGLSGGYEFEAIQEWEYDKSPALEEVLMRPARKFHLTRTYLSGFFKPAPQPADVVVLKECSAYFPGDLQLGQKQELMERWVREVRQRNIKVIVATAVPVTRERAAQEPGKHQAVLVYNDWIRDYARKNDLPLLDLEAALRTDERERYLRNEFANDDGSHVNSKAYGVLDKVMWKAVCPASRGAACT